MNNLLKTILILIFSALITIAQAEDIENVEAEYSRLSMDKKCFVKSYKNGSYTDEEPKKFRNVRIFSKLHKKTTDTASLNMKINYL